MNMIMVKVLDEDAKKLTDTIIEVEACRELHEEAMKRADYNGLSVKIELDYYMECLKVHKALWREILVKYIGEEDASMMFNILRFDTVKKVIFQIEIEGCSLCQK
jgi:hypothetical protein